MKPSPEDMARDLAADLAEFDDLSREVGIGLAFGQEPDSRPYVEDVYDMARLALASLRIALVRALAAEAHVDALQASLDAAEADRDQLRAIFACDLLEDSEALRLAYERGKADAKREYSTEINQAFEHLTDSDHDDGEDFDEFNEGLWDDTATGPTESTLLPPGVHMGTVDVLHDGTAHLAEFVRDAAMRAMGLPGPVFQGEPSFPPVTLEAKKLPLQVRVTDELLRDAGGAP